jgi:hypothetical protein
MVSRAEPRRVALRWQKSYRIVASKHPPVNVFADIVAPAQMAAAAHIESLTNDRLIDETSAAALVPAHDRVQAPGASIVMAAFTHIGRASRFSNGSYGVYYAAHSIETAVRETAFHRGRFMAATGEPPGELDMRAYVGRPLQPFADIRGGKYHHLHRPDDYTQSQAFAASLRERDEWGLVYRSVRHEGGECMAAFRPQAISIPLPGAALAYIWDGERIARVYEKSEVLFEL